MIRNATLGDAAAICNIYNHYVLHTIITFEEEPVTEEDMAQRITTISADYPWLVYEENDTIIGYAYAGSWKTRSAYRFTVESSVYLHHQHHGKGLGRKLYNELIHHLRQRNIHTVIGGISLPNEASIALHEKLGFKYLGKFDEVGLKFNNYIDVGYWTLTL